MYPADLQRQTLRFYGELVSRRESWSGQLIFTSGAGCSATGLPSAVSIAGGTTLALDSDAAIVKAVFRQGGIDFVVNTLDEALRVLKNEIRQHKPLSVALISGLQPTLAEMRERGVLTDLHVPLEVPGNQFPFAKSHLHLITHEGVITPTPHLTAWLVDRNWSESALSSTPELPLRALDAQLLAALPPTDTLRRAWIQRIAHYQRSIPGGSRFLWRTSGEILASLPATAQSPKLL